MPSMSDQAPKKPKRPRDANQLAKSIVDVATHENDSASSDGKAKDPAAVSLGRRGGLKGGKARASVLSSDDRRRIASFAAKKRWSKQEEGDEQ